MSSFTLKGVPWAPGTSVGAYPRRSEVLPETGAPGTALETQTVAADASLTYTTLADGEYRAAAAISGTWRYVSFNVKTTAAQAYLDQVLGPDRYTGCLAATGQLGTRKDASTLVSGTLYVGRCLNVIPVGVSVLTLKAVAGNTPAAGPTNQWMVVLDGAGRVLAVSADKLTEAWALDAEKTFTLTSPYVGQGTQPWLGIMVAAATPPNLMSDVHGRAAITRLDGRRGATSSTAQTTPPAVGATMAAFADSVSIPLLMGF